jgi:hypothetical protein
MRPQVDGVQYPRIPSRILKGAHLLDEGVIDDVVAEIGMSKFVADEAMKIRRS